MEVIMVYPSDQKLWWGELKSDKPMWFVVVGNTFVSGPFNSFYQANVSLEEEVSSSWEQ